MTGPTNVQTALEWLMSNKADVTDLDDYLPLSGGTMAGGINLVGANTLSATGSLVVAAGGTVTLGQNGTANLHAVTVQQLNQAITDATLVFDNVSLVGAGTAGDPKRVGTINGGTF
jgi:hypothetical protein